ncbi:MAG: hypothetical protein EOM06_04770 [Sphingobacteriia bacterium]|nr:hypothetical protein [Sphingobacteriia bacterium]
MQNPLSDGSCIAGLIIIFITAAIFRADFTWIAGVVMLLGFLIVSNLAGEFSRRTTLMMTIFSWIFTALTIVCIILFNVK